LEIDIGICLGFHPAQAETDAVVFSVNLDHAQGYHVAFLEDFLRVLNALFADFGDMDQTFHIICNPGKCAKLGQAGDSAFHKLTHLELR